jgi:hypothetical protein
LVAVAPSKAKSSLEDSRILDKEKFNKGGRLLVVPFTPGVNVAANEELDRVSLMIVRGIADSLNDNAHFIVLNSGNADTADLILEGRIVAMTKPGQIKKLVSKKKKYIAIEGKLIDAKSGDIVCYFTDREESQSRKQPFADLGSSIGQDIGKFLDSSVD